MSNAQHLSESNPPRGATVTAYLATVEDRSQSVERAKITQAVFLSYTEAAMWVAEEVDRIVTKGWPRLAPVTVIKPVAAYL